MPRKPKREKKTKIVVIVVGKSINVTLFPPTPPRRSWYVYWPGLVASKSTGAQSFDDAVIAAETMLRNGGKRAGPEDTALSDEGGGSLGASGKRPYLPRLGDKVPKCRWASVECWGANFV